MQNNKVELGEEVDLTQKFDVNYLADEDVVLIELDHPIEFGSEKYTELKIKCPTWGNLKGIDLERLTMDTIMLLASRLSGLSSQRIEKLKRKDIRKVIEAVSYFLVECLDTKS